MSITRAEISLGEDLAVLFRDESRVLTTALFWDFADDDDVCRGLSLPQWPWERGDSPTVELQQRRTGGAHQEARHQVTPLEQAEMVSVDLVEDVHAHCRRLD